MNIDLFKQRSSNLFTENKLLKLGFIVVLAITMLNWYGVKSARDDVRTIILAPGSGGHLEVGNASASNDYLISMARYIIHLNGDYTASSARVQFEELLKLFAPEAYGEAVKRYMDEAKEIERFATVASNTYWADDAVTFQANTIQVRAVKVRYINGNAVRSEGMRYKISYEIRAGRFYVVAFEEAPEHA